MVFASARVASTAVVPMSITRPSGAMPFAMPSPAPTILSTAGVSVAITMTTGARSATSRGECAGASPSAASASTTARLRLWMTTSAPAACRFMAIGRPISPRPMNPTTCPESGLFMTCASWDR